MDAQAIANGLSDGINSLWGLLATLGGLHDAQPARALMTPSEIAGGLEAMDHALAALADSGTARSSFRPSDEDVPRLRRLRQLVAVWENTGVVAPDLVQLAEEALKSAMAWP
jgi:hypothetical protein